MTPIQPRRPGSDPVAELLGASRAAGPRSLLGLGSGSIDADVLEAALRTRKRAVRGQADRFPAKAVDEACRALDFAAAALREVGESDATLPPVRSQAFVATAPKPDGPIATRPKGVEAGGTSSGNRPRTPVKPTARISENQLTPFDRLVLSVLVAGGGWNSRTRTIVAGLAAQVGLDAEKLGRVVEGLAGFMRDHGSAGTIGETALVATPRPPAPGRVEAAMVRVSDGITREFRGESAGSRIRLAFIFGGLAAFFGAILVIALTAPSPGVRDIEQRRLAAEEAIAEREAADAAAAIDPEHRVTPSVREGVVRPARFDRPPMFRGEGRPDAAVFQLERVPVMLEEASQLARQLELDPTTLSARRASAWDDVVATVAGTWPLMTPDDRGRYLTAILKVLEQAGDATVADRLSRSFAVDPEAGIDDPIEVWSRAFHAGLLGSAASNPSLPETVRDPARARLDAILAGSTGRNVRGGPFAALAGRALDRMTVPLVAMINAVDDAVVRDAWERWFDAMEAIRNDARRQAGLLLAVETALLRSTGLADQGMSSDLLGRLLLEIDWTAAGPDPEGVRDAYGKWMLDPSIPVGNLWVLASLLEGAGRAGWFRPEFVPDPERGMPDRRRVQMLADDVWPDATGSSPRGNLLLIEPGLLASYDLAFVEVESMIERATSPVERLLALLAAERLATTGALLAAERPAEARALLQRMGSETSDVDLDSIPRPRAMEPDGEWADAWRKAGSDQQARRDLIAALRRNVVAGDLGPRDAAVFVEAVWRGPLAIREAAQAAAIERFNRGPVVAVELLDTSDRASRNEATLGFIEAYTGVSLPGRGMAEAESRIRSALATHAIALLDPDRELIDRLTDVVLQSIAERGRIRSGDADAPANGLPAAVTADAARAVANGLFLAASPTVRIEEIDRRRTARRGLVRNGIQGLVAEHVAELEFLGFVVEAEVPSKRAEVSGLLTSAALARSDAPSVLEQAALEAVAIAAMDRLRFIARDLDPLGDSG
ncbi:MAG: hypothetical protein CMJ27_12835 [Phycisphaerae bacterium]|nr:hypothetical protein [Phycisphaerae bacterium]OUX00116.1 MAG: hypothetical protein CBD91_07380 [Phycisphaeraceae bacterium TMED231]